MQLRVARILTGAPTALEGVTEIAALVRLRKPLPADESAWEETDERRITEFVRLANG